MTYITSDISTSIREENVFNVTNVISISRRGLSNVKLLASWLPECSSDVRVMRGNVSSGALTTTRIKEIIGIYMRPLATEDKAIQEGPRFRRSKDNQGSKKPGINRSLSRHLPAAVSFSSLTRRPIPSPTKTLAPGLTSTNFEENLFYLPSRQTLSQPLP